MNQPAGRVHAVGGGWIWVRASAGVGEEISFWVAAVSSTGGDVGLLGSDGAAGED